VYSSNEDVPDNVLDVSYMSVDITSQDNFQRSAFIDTTLGSNALLNTGNLINNFTVFICVHYIVYE